MSFTQFCDDLHRTLQWFMFVSANLSHYSVKHVLSKYPPSTDEHLGTFCIGLRAHFIWGCNDSTVSGSGLGHASQSVTRIKPQRSNRSGCCRTVKPCQTNGWCYQCYTVLSASWFSIAYLFFFVSKLLAC